LVIYQEYIQDARAIKCKKKPKYHYATFGSHQQITQAGKGAGSAVQGTALNHLAILIFNNLFKKKTKIYKHKTKFRSVPAVLTYRLLKDFNSITIMLQSCTAIIITK
jgi:hypothetical protein